MDSSFSSKEIHAVASGADSLISLLERGIDYTRQGAYIEGAAFFTLARDQLTPGQEYFTGVLDAFLRSQASYWQADQSLHLASKRFVEADNERQTQLFALEKLLSSLSKETNRILQAHAIAQPPETSKGHQSQQPHQSLQLIRVGSNHFNDSSGGMSPPQLPLKDEDALPNLYITCFGRFEVKRLDQPIVLCHSRHGQAILRYLVAQTGYRVPVDKLMDVLWAQDTPEMARRKLQVAVSAVRRSLNNGYHCGLGEGYILCKDGVYQFNPLVTIRTDVDEFLSLWQAGRQSGESESAALYERACNLCSGPFLVEDMYADWSFIQREQLKQIYFTMCRFLAGYYLKIRRYEDAVKWAGAILREDHCDEAAHRQLILIYVAQGCRSEALQQYYRCEHILSKELGVSPMPETMNLLQTILTSADSPSHEYPH